MTASRKVWYVRKGVVASTVAVIAAGGAIGAGVFSGSFDSPDLAAPSAFITAPAAAATVSGASVTVSATCGDNVGCAGVQFKLDGSNLGAEDTSAPFSITWDSTGTVDGSHTVTAVARDAAGNTVTTSGATVTVSNAAGGGGSTARIWVATTGNDSCTRNASLVALGSASGHICATFNRAANIASSGDTILVDNGSYSAQTITETNTAAFGARVVFEPSGSDNTVVTVAGLTTSGVKNLEFDYMTLTGQTEITWNGSGGITNPGSVVESDNIRLVHDHIGSQFGGLEILGATHAIVDHSEIGPIGGCPLGTDIGGTSASNCASANASPIVDIKSLWCGDATNCASGEIVPGGDSNGSGITNSTIHDINYTNVADHQQCVGLWGPQNIVFTGNKLWNCGGNQGILMSTSDGHAGSDFVSGTIENNYVGTVCDQFSTEDCGASQSTTWNNNSGGLPLINPLLIVNNSFAGDLHIGQSGGTNDVLFSGSGSLVVANNIAAKIATNASVCPTFNTPASSTFTHNYVVSTVCGSDNSLAHSLATIWTNWTQSGVPGHSSTFPDMSLTATGVTDLAAKASATYAPGTDIAGTTRPCGGSPSDVGAYESCSG